MKRKIRTKVKRGISIIFVFLLSVLPLAAHALAAIGDTPSRPPVSVEAFCTPTEK